MAICRSQPCNPLSPGVTFANHVFVLLVIPQHEVFLPLVWRGLPELAAGAAVPAAAPAASAFPWDRAGVSRARTADGFAFAAPITITIRYSDADLGAIDESALQLIYWTGSGWADAADTCVPPSVYIRDLAGNVLTLEVCHLTEFDMVGQ